MQNKFTKGILERQEREYKSQKAVQPTESAASTVEAPAGNTPAQKSREQSKPPAAAVQPIIPQDTPVQEAPTVTTAPAEPVKQNPLDPLSAYIIRDSGRKAKNKTFYLDGAVIQAIRRAAAAQHVPESKLVNDILKKILLPQEGTH